MPLLMCPNCQEGMKQVNRESVQIDMCPKCHGVWLDRGELQKLLEASRGDSLAYAQPAPSAPAPQQQHIPHGQPPHGHHKHGHYGDDYRYRRKSKLESIFDIFD